jgi:hypothetical protein
MERKEQSSGHAKREIFLLRCIFRLTRSNILANRSYTMTVHVHGRECFISVFGF